MKSVHTRQELHQAVKEGYYNLRYILKLAHRDSGLNREETERAQTQEYNALKRDIFVADEDGINVKFRHSDWPAAVILRPAEMLRSEIDHKGGNEGEVYIPSAKAHELLDYFKTRGKTQPPALKARNERQNIARNLEMFSSRFSEFGETPPVPVFRILEAANIPVGSITYTTRKIREAMAGSSGADEFAFNTIPLSKGDFLDVKSTPIGRSLWVAGKSADALARSLAPGADIEALAAKNDLQHSIERLNKSVRSATRA